MQCKHNQVKVAFPAFPRAKFLRNTRFMNVQHAKPAVCAIRNTRLATMITQSISRTHNIWNPIHKWQNYQHMIAIPCPRKIPPTDSTKPTHAPPRAPQNQLNDICIKQNQTSIMQESTVWRNSMCSTSLLLALGGSFTLLAIPSGSSLGLLFQRGKQKCQEIYSGAR